MVNDAEKCALEGRTRIVKIFYTDHFELPLPPGHRFPMAKYLSALGAGGCFARNVVKEAADATICNSKQRKVP